MKLTTHFFQGVNQKMTYEIKKTDFSLANGTALSLQSSNTLTVPDIYKETISEF